MKPIALSELPWPLGGGDGLSRGKGPDTLPDGRRRFQHRGTILGGPAGCGNRRTTRNVPSIDESDPSAHRSLRSCGGDSGLLAGKVPQWWGERSGTSPSRPRSPPTKPPTESIGRFGRAKASMITGWSTRNLSVSCPNRRDVHRRRRRWPSRPSHSRRGTRRPRFGLHLHGRGAI